MPAKFRNTPATETSTPAFLTMEIAFHDAMDAMRAAGLREDEAGPRLVALARGGDIDTALQGIPDDRRPSVTETLQALMNAALQLKRGHA